MFGIGPMELIIVLIIALVFFGPKKIPEIANALGRSLNEFKKGSQELEASVRREIEAGEKKALDAPAEKAESNR